MLHIDTYTSNFEPNDTFSNMNTNMYTNNTYEPHITATPVVKSHNPISIFTPNQQQQHFMQQQTIFAPLETANMVTNLNNMEIDEYFAPPPPLNMDNAMFNNTMQNVYSPSSTSVTTNNSSIMFMDSSISPSSPINMMSPINQQNMSNSDYPMVIIKHYKLIVAKEKLILRILLLLKTTPCSLTTIKCIQKSL